VSDESAILPPIGQIVGISGEEGKAVSYLTDLARESLEAAEPWIQQAATNLQVYTYGRDPSPAATDVISNAIQDDIAAITDQQTKEPPVTKLQPVETNEPGPVYRMDMPAPPMTPEEAAALTQPTLAGVDPMGQPVAGPPLVDPAQLIEITDEVAADFYQKQFDVYWTRGRMDAALRRAVLYTNIYGFLFPLYEWRSDERKPKLHTNISLHQVYIDPTVDVIDEAQYAGVDWWIDMQQAMRMFPQIADMIAQESTRGQPVRPDSSTQLGFNVDRNFRRNNVILRIFWLRNQPCPMDPELALAGGHVEQRAVPVENPPQEKTDGATADQGDSAAVPPDVGDGSEGAEVQPQPEGSAGGLPDAGAAQGLPVPGPQTRPGLFLPNTDTEVDPDHPLWPTYPCIRQITVVRNIVVDDRVCPYLDIPILHNVATHIPAQLYGQGLPQRLQSMQDGRNRALTNMVKHTDQYAHPVRVYPQSTWEQLPEKYKQQGASIAGMNVIIEDDLYRSLNGKVQVAEQPEQMAPALGAVAGDPQGRAERTLGQPRGDAGQDARGCHRLAVDPASPAGRGVAVRVQRPVDRRHGLPARAVDAALAGDAARGPGPATRRQPVPGMGHPGDPRQGAELVPGQGLDRHRRFDQHGHGHDQGPQEGRGVGAAEHPRPDHGRAGDQHGDVPRPRRRGRFTGARAQPACVAAGRTDQRAGADAGRRAEPTGQAPRRRWRQQTPGSE
jgi:hypothetical protein